MSRTLTEETFTTVGAVPYWSYTGSWANVSDANASGGAYKSSSTPGDTATFTIPVTTGITGLLLTCSRIARTGIAAITVDGVAFANWAQDNFTTAAATAGQTYTVATKTQPIAWQRTAYRPIDLSAAPNAVHTVVVAVVAGPVTIDAAETYVSAAIVVGRITTLGTSVPAGFGLGSPTTQRFSALAAAAIGGTDDNHAYGSSAHIYNTNVTSLDPPPVGWLQAEGNTGSVGGANVAAATQNTTGAYTVAPTGVTFTGGAPSVAATGTPVTSGVSPNIHVDSITITNIGAGYGSAPTIAFTGGTGTAATFTAVLSTASAYTGGAHSWGRTPEFFVFNHGLNDISAFSGTDPGGGLGYVSELFKQRVREAIWRVNLNSPDTQIVVMGLSYTNNAALYPTYNALLLTAASESTMRNVAYIDSLPAMTNNGGLTLIQGDLTHPNIAGHQLLGRDLLIAMLRGRARPGTRGGVT